MPIRRFVQCNLLLLASVFGMTLPAWAQGVLEGEVAVSSQEDGVVTEGLGRILSEILVRTGGSADAASHSAAQAAIAAPRDYVQTFTFRSETVLQAGVPTRLLYLRASFDRRTIQSLLRDGGLDVVASDGAPQSMRIEVSPLRSGGDFARCLSALRSLPIVRQLEVTEAAPDRLLLRATVAGGSGALLTSVDEGGVFRPLGTGSDPDLVLLELL
ncbi:MAG: DUF2066 domain-containing protein [Xanthomonadales bacterium]|nr:DUF2066 domain-containing protein [Xanthomonadales bacterium]